MGILEQLAELKMAEARAMHDAAQSVKPTPAQAAYMAASMAPGFASADAAGQAGRMPGPNETLQQGLLAPGVSIKENFQRGNYLDTGLQGLGLLGDAAYAVPLAGPALAGALKAPRAVSQVAKLRAFHGSPYKFNRFSDDAIGTGEGAQAYGYGHYLAEREGTAQSYRDSLTPRDMDYEKYLMDEYKLAESNENYERMEMLERAMMHDTPTDFRTLATDSDYDDNYRQMAADMADEIESTGTNFGSMYEVEVDADPSELLGYDQPLSKQSPDLQRRVNQAIKASRSPLLKKETDELYQGLLAEGFEPPMVDGKPVEQFGNEALAEITGNLRMARDAELGRINAEMSKQAKIMEPYEIPGRFGKYTDPKGEAAKKKYDALMGERSRLPDNFNQRAAQLLKEAGVKGIKYADAQTRFSPGEKTSNYVIFDPRLIEISRRYGVPIAVAAGMLSQMDAEVTQQPKGLL